MMAPMAALLIASMASSLIQPVVFSLINAINGRRFMRADKGQDFLPLLITSMMNALAKGVTTARRGYNKMDHINKNLAPTLYHYQITNYFNYKPRFNGIFFKDTIYLE